MTDPVTSTGMRPFWLISRKAAVPDSPLRNADIDLVICDAEPYHREPRLVAVAGILPTLEMYMKRSSLRSRMVTAQPCSGGTGPHKWHE